MQVMTFSVLLAASQLLLVVEGDPLVPRARVDAVEAQIATILSGRDYDYRTVGDLQTLEGTAAQIEEANTAMEEGVRLYVEVELDSSRESLDRAVELYRGAGADLWRAPQLARALLFRGLVDLALSDPDGAASHFSDALQVDPTLSLEKGTYAPPVIAAFERSREAFLQTGFQPRPPEVWGGAARRLSATGVVLVKILQDEERGVSMAFLEVAPEGAMSTKSRETARSTAPPAIERTAHKLLDSALGKPPPPKWRKWAYIGGGTLATGVLIIIAGAVNQPRVDTQIVVPTPTP